MCVSIIHTVCVCVTARPHTHAHALKHTHTHTCSVCVCVFPALSPWRASRFLAETRRHVATAELHPAVTSCQKTSRRHDAAVTAEHRGVVVVVVVVVVG